MLNVREKDRRQEAERLAHEYFSGNESPLCENCGEELLFRTDYGPENRFGLRISCAGCGRRLRWRQHESPGEWDTLHLRYFLERVTQGDAPRCPIDDSGISFAEFEGGVLEFRCPFCNRRGRIEATEGPAKLHLNENESIVFLTV
jgi:hypothetical protein